jgi:hypothetical protein
MYMHLDSSSPYASAFVSCFAYFSTRSYETSVGFQRRYIAQKKELLRLLMNLDLQVRQKYSYGGTALGENKICNVGNAVNCEALKMEEGEIS